MTDENTDTDSDGPADSTQIILPKVDTAAKYRGRRIRDLVYAAPGGAVAAGGALLGVGGLALPVVGALAGVGGYVSAARTGEHSSPLDRARAPVRSRRRRSALPRSHDDLASAPVHGVRRILSRGFVEMDDGRLVAFIRLHGRNTDLETTEERQRFVSSLSGRASDRIGEWGIGYYSTTGRFDPADVADRLRETAYSGAYARGSVGQTLLEDLAAWYQDVEAERWDARRWHHYATVEVRPWEVDAPDEVDGGGWTAAVVDHLLGRTSSSTATDRHRLLVRMRGELQDRVATLAGSVFGPAAGVDAEHADAEEAAAVVASYWNGTTPTPARTAEGDVGPDRLGELLSAPGFDVGDEYVRVGRQYARTYWIADWPSEPAPSFLRDLTAMRTVDVDVRLRFGHLDQDAAEARVKDKLTSLDADLKERQEQTDLSSLTVEDATDNYVLAYLQLHRGDARAWDVNGYVTVRAGTEKALDAAEERLQERAEDEGSVALDVERARALEADADDVVDLAEGAPAEATLISPSTRQRDLFESASPAGRDVYRATSHTDRAHLALGGVIGAAFPATTAVYRHAGGIPWGRQVANGSEVVADPFDVGGPGHGLFLGDSGSGKTFSVVLRALRWFLEDPDRTLVLAGPFGDLSGLVDALDGDRLVVGGRQTLNPLAFTPASEHARRQGVDPLGNKVREVDAFLSGILREEGVDPGPFGTATKSTAFETFERAGILKDDPTTHGRPSPTMDDFRDTLADVAEAPDEEAYSASDVEVGEVEQKAGILSRKLSGFDEGREYDQFTGRDDFDVAEGELSYVDLQQLESLGSVGKSAALQAVLSRIYQTVKTAGETLVVLDEAHYLLHNEETLEWLQRASRHWRHHDGGVWLSSQRPDEFVDLATDENSGENHHETIRTQCSIKQITNLDGIGDEVAERFGLNDRRASWAEDRATRGDADVGHSEALLSFRDMEGWTRVQVRASPLEEALLTHEPGEDPPVDEYLQEHGVADRGGRRRDRGDRDGVDEHDVADALDAVADGGRTE